MNRWLFILLIIAIIAGIIGAALSVAMVIRAVQWSEWGRVVLYSCTMAACIEMTVISGAKLLHKEKS